MCGCGAQAQRIEAEWERTNVADVDDVEGLLRLPGLGLLDQVAARLILAGLQRVLLFLRLGVVVRPQLCHLPSRQLKLPTQRNENGEPSASGNSSSLPPLIRNPQRSLFYSTPAAWSERRSRLVRILQYHCVYQGCHTRSQPHSTSSCTPSLQTLYTQSKAIRPPPQRAQLRAHRVQWWQHRPLVTVSDYRLKGAELLPHTKQEKKESCSFFPLHESSRCKEAR